MSDGVPAGPGALGVAHTGYGDPAFSQYIRRAALAGAGYDSADLSRPLIGVTDLTSDYNPCHALMPRLIEAVKRGVLEGGGVPFVFPTMSLGELLVSPTTMLYRNLLAMETEELVRAQPMDAVVMLGGCDKTIPAQMMAAASLDVPVILDVVGPALTGSWRGQPLGACTDCRRLWAEYRGGRIDEDEIGEVESSLFASPGTCTVMGTASTMALIAETLGMTLPGAATPPAPTGARYRHAVATGRHAVQLAHSGPVPSQVLTRAAFENAARVLAATGGSTNAVVHLLAIAHRASISLDLDDIEHICRETPLLAKVKPTGSKFMPEFHDAGGSLTLLRELAPLLHLDHRGVTGAPLGELLADASPHRDPCVIATLELPAGPPGALAVLRGSLVPQGALIKAGAGSPELMVHEGPALVFDSPEDAARRLDDPTLEVTPNHILVLRNAGPVACGMPEAGSLPIPRRLARQGVQDMLRISDGRMSGTSYGTVVLHCCPESATGGPLGLVRDGDTIRLDVPGRRLDLLVDEAQLAARLREWRPPQSPARGWRRLYAEHVLSASEGADLDFLR